MAEEPSLVDTGRGITVRYKNRYLYSSLDPLDPIKRRIENLPLLEKTLFFVPSIGLGYGLRELLERLPDNSHVLCVEVDQVLMKLAISQPYLSLPKSPQLSIVRTDDPGNLIRMLHTLGIEQFRRVQPLHLCRAYELYRDAYDRMQMILEEELQTYWKNKITMVHMGRLWVRNALENLHRIAWSESLESLSTRSPVVVAGAGPSLEDSLSLIRQIRERVVLLATDTALPVLASERIRPDAVIALESQLVNIQDFIGMLFEGVPLICDITCSPNVVQLFDNPIYFFSSAFYPLSLFERMSAAGLMPFQLPPLGSVGVTALYIALELTRAPVFVAGLDFSYIRNQSHARGTPIYRLMYRRASRILPVGQISYESILKRPLLKVKGEDGKDLQSDLVLHGYAQQVSRIYRKRPRFFKLSYKGFDIGAPAVETEAQFEREMGNHPFLSENGFVAELRPRETGKASSESFGQKLERFVEQETNRLARGVETIGNLIRSGGEDVFAASPGAPLMNLLEELDYLYFYFPDPFPKGSLTRDYLVRILASAQAFLPRWGRILRR